MDLAREKAHIYAILDMFALRMQLSHAIRISVVIVGATPLTDAL